MSKAKKQKIGVIGFGNLAEALISRFIAAKAISPSQVLVAPHRKAKDNRLAKKHRIKIAKNLTELCQKCTILLIAVKPQQLPEVLDVLREHYQGQTIWTVVSALPIKFYKRKLGAKAPVIRLMPNTPCQIGHGATTFYASPQVSASQSKFCQKTFSSTGLVTKLTSEKQMHAAVSLVGSGPAFVYEFTRQLQVHGQKLGLSKKAAEELAVQVVIGAGQMMAGSPDIPGLIQKVKSKKGTTEAGLKTLHEQKFGSILSKCLKSAMNRSLEMAKTLDQET